MTAGVEFLKTFGEREHSIHKFAVALEVTRHLIEPSYQCLEIACEMRPQELRHIHGKARWDQACELSTRVISDRFECGTRQCAQFLANAARFSQNIRHLSRQAIDLCAKLGAFVIQKRLERCSRAR